MRIAILGNNDGPLRLARSLHDSEHEVICIGLQKQPDIAFAKAYEELSATLEQTPKEKHAIRFLQNHDIDLLINCFANFRFSKLLETYKVLNIHLSPLPKYRGRHPMHWALINGEKSFGGSIHRMTAEIDAGAILYQNKVDVNRDMSVKELREAIFGKLVSDFPKFMDQLDSGSIQEKPNDDAEATYVARRFPEDSQIREWGDSRQIYRQVKALRSENDQAFLLFNGNKFRVQDVREANRHYVGVAAPFVYQRKNQEVGIACKDGKTLTFILGKTRNIQLNDRPDGY